MKQHYTKILLFSLPLNILLSLYAHNKSKPYLTPHHTPTTTPRVLSEKDIKSSIRDNDADIKSVKENFDRQTSQRFEEYDERMKEKRQKRKEERDKNIQEIIEKDKRDKSLAEKIEKGCLKCGCALGGGVLPVWGLISGIWYAILSQHATKLATEAGIKKGLQVGLEKVTEIVTRNMKFTTLEIPPIEKLKVLTTGISGDNVTLRGIFECIHSNKGGLGKAGNYDLFLENVKTMVQKPLTQFSSEYPQDVAAVANAVAEGEAAEFTAKTGLLSNTIIASVVTILVIVLVMVIIYLVLRYRRKKKMHKKAQYTKLLNQ
ncbi:rifin PIR protein, putative [Plasmodium reichenowi]|uniref:Rifin PIR protein, putative n=1 Tax=Plasmodium reichenowi TaxID=5854 RepID=A0A2P9D9N5_PLARE|nr:rifin PIR protein, putative [Plasmodium reichenowi]